MNSNQNNDFKLSEKDVKHIARLANLELCEADLKKFPAQLEALLKQAKILDEVNTSNVKAIAQITGINNRVYQDLVQSEHLSEKLLKQSKQSIEKNMIKVNNIL